METRILLMDEVAEAGYLYLLSNQVPIPVVTTEESDATESIVFDYAENGRIVGIEVFDLVYRKLKQMPETKRYEATDNGYYWGFDKPEATFDFAEKGVTIHFADPLFEDFIGYTITDTKLYSKKELDKLI
ncbi:MULTISPECIES: DUF2283 domain-containing protein [Brochothrix]|uniref:DUF2283 domain-containing protein n=1 Tax=Brochothrix thermosphacta TaxID=2756 RepID=A0A1D2KW57_BROTH|nr:MULTISPECIES: DUF2283 domain-containing protein [Brochothrix]SLM94228.1 hypothetical protein FM106_07735 [Brachybacterium faecium]ANZ94218.1 hypothetical protein BFC19_01610 [Brochothrix thermosphacta]ATF26927.1 DUF2283 domain-containing protein [Brochothrix thermosphacta]ATH86284.1 DUF2283 domain-containing protein [Brochothrix thermosphacta]EUJ37700.1 hypothetical protein BTHER_04019 [Brochothrix thermosphacta DSM 20171 = FSL F6-1036]